MKKLIAGTALCLAGLLAYPVAVGAQTHQQAELAPGESISSQSGSYRLVHQGDGNVVLYDAQGQAHWHTHTHGRATDRLIFQADGNLVLYAAGGAPLWHTHTHGKGDVLAVQDDANIVIYGDSGAPAWARFGMAPPVQVASAFQANSVWDRLAQCESGGNWHINTGNGYSGGLQWAPSSWNAFKEPGAPRTAAEASREQEIAAGERYRAYEQAAGRGGFGPWPSCARQLGLPR